MQKLFLGEPEILWKEYQNKTNKACEGGILFDGLIISILVTFKARKYFT